jgi:hypothetical protein
MGLRPGKEAIFTLLFGNYFEKALERFRMRWNNSTTMLVQTMNVERVSN